MTGEPNNLRPDATDAERPAAALGGPCGWYRSRLYAHAFGPRGGERRERIKRWRKALGPDLVRRIKTQDTEWVEVRGDAGLADGRTVAEAAQSTAFRHIPDEIKRAGRGSKQLDLWHRVAYQWDQELQAARLDLPPTTERYFAELERLHGAEAREHGISLKDRAVRYRRERGPEGPFDRRFNSGRRPDQHDPRLIERVNERYVHQNQFTQVDAYEEQLRLAAELKIAPLTRSAVNTYIAKLPAVAKAAGRLKPREFEARHIPKMRLDYTRVSAGDWLCLDGRVADVQVRIPDAGGGWRATRLTVTGVMDMRSTKLAVDVRQTENWTGILCGLRAWIDPNGMPRRVTMDRGEAYKKTARAHGSRVIKCLIDRFVPQLASIFDRFGVEVLQADPYSPWQKRIESIWRMLKRHCDRWVRSFWGGSPRERPEASETLVKEHVEELPTAEEFREFVLTAVETYNATPRRALGELSPNEMFDRFRGAVRRVDPEVLDTYFTIADGPRRVGRDGVRFNNMLYTLAAEDLVKLSGCDVWVLPRLDNPGVIALCDQQERLLCYGVQQQLVKAGDRKSVV